MPRGELFILSAPSGAGKTTLIRHLFGNPLLEPGSLAFSVSHTTRLPRPGELDGKDYHFVDAPTFEAMIRRGEFLEWARVHGQLYGTSEVEVVGRLERGIDVVLDIDVQGARQVVEKIPEARTIFILPPSFEVLRQRLHGRGVDDPAEIDRRLSVALSEIPEYQRYQYVILNDIAERAGAQLAAIILDKRSSLERMRDRVEALWREPAQAISPRDPST